MEKIDTNCIICGNSIEIFAIGECNHFCVCAVCCLRLRLLVKDKRCPYCRVYYLLFRMKMKK